MRIVVTTCAAYAPILGDFARAFQRAWPNCAWPVRVICAGAPAARIPVPRQWWVRVTAETDWTASLLWGIAESEAPFLLLLDDYILDAVDRDLLVAAARLMISQPRYGMVRVHPCPGPEHPWRHNPDFGAIAPDAPYALSLQPALWRPAYLRAVLRRGETPWEVEIDGSRRVAALAGAGQLRHALAGTQRSAVGYRGLMRRGREVPETRAWITENLPC